MNGVFNIRLGESYSMKGFKLYDLVSVSFVVNPSDAIVLLNIEGIEQYSKEVVVGKGTTIDYTITADGYITKTGTIVANEDIVETVELEADLTTFYAWYDPNPAISFDENTDAHYVYTLSETPEAMSNAYFINNNNEILGTIMRVKSYDSSTNTITTGWGSTCTRASSYDKRIKI